MRLAPLLSLTTALLAPACQRADEAPATASPESSGSLFGLIDLGSGMDTAALEFHLPKGPFETPTPLLRWTAPQGAASYGLEIDDSEDCTTPLASYTARLPSLQVTMFLANGAYHACLTAKDAQGTVLARTTTAFTVLAQGVADPRQQNTTGASGAPLNTPDLTPLVLFQSDWQSRVANRGSTQPRRDGVAAPYSIGAFADPHDGYRVKFLVTDRENHRLLIFNQLPDRADALPDVVVGQSDFNAGRPNGGRRTGAAGLSDPVHATVCPSGRLLVTDRANNRVLVWQRIPRENGVPADLVIGQKDFSQGGAATSATRLDQPHAAYCLKDRLLILDRGNHRILVYKKFPKSSGAAADFAIGQPNFKSSAARCTEDGLGLAYEALVQDERLFIVDGGHHRVLVYNRLPDDFGAKADLVLGQSDLRHCEPNRGGPPSAATLAWPNGLAYRDGVLAVSDYNNRRVLFYRNPTRPGQEAEHLLGQPDFQSTTLLNPPEPLAIGGVKGLIFDGGHLWVSDHLYRRVAVLPLPF